MNDSIRQGAGRPVTLAEALHILKCVHTLSPAEQRDIDEAIRCIVAFDGITDEMVEQALAAANGAMVDTRRYWTDSDKAAVRAMLEAVIEAVPPRSTRPEVGEKDEAYRQRNVLVATLARLYPSGVRRTKIDGWSSDWHGCVYIDLPSGQISYHYHDSQTYLFLGLPAYTKEWDGHDKETVERRLEALRSPPATFPKEQP